MFIPLNGPAIHGKLIVTTTAVEVKVGASVLEERTIITIQPVDGDIYFGYSSGVTSATGTKIFKGQIYPMEATDKLPVYIVAATGTVDVRITEVS